MPKLIYLGLERMAEIPHLDNLLVDHHDLFWEENRELYKLSDYYPALVKYLDLVKESYYYELSKNQEYWGG